ncbi:ABC transporter substrate-binding protein [Bradyrhizobium sp. INPA03-11B]|uniref:ABC transporter substrate-binding protein n=1 Tax=Bradyrhizobium sp. INPA03-11B TaxID=418598 RepID=UPI00338DFBBC
MRRREFIALVVGAAAWPIAARAQLARKMAHIGIVSIGGPTTDMTGPLPPNRTVRAFLRGMAELGYVYGRDFVTEPRGTDSIAAVAELAGLQLDVIVATGGGPSLSLLKQATTTIPVVMTAASDPVRQGLVQSLAHPGGNFTGMSMQTLELTGKRLELLKELVPSAEVVAVFWDSTDAGLWPAAAAVGQALGWKLLSVEVRDAAQIAEAFKTAATAGAGALLIPASGLLFSHASQIVELAALSRIPTMYELRSYVDVGGLVSYGANIEDIWRRAATYVDKILKGANPAELPIEQPTSFELVINKRTAVALGLNMSPSVLMRADEVIE